MNIFFVVDLFVAVLLRASLEVRFWVALILAAKLLLDQDSVEAQRAIRSGGAPSPGLARHPRDAAAQQQLHLARSGARLGLRGAPAWPGARPAALRRAPWRFSFWGILGQGLQSERRVYFLLLLLLFRWLVPEVFVYRYLF